MARRVVTPDGAVIRTGSRSQVLDGQRPDESLRRGRGDVGGTASGEHGIDMGKLKFMRQEHRGAVDVLGRIKAALDPAGIMNPGKMVTRAESRVPWGRHQPRKSNVWC